MFVSTDEESERFTQKPFNSSVKHITYASCEGKVPLKLCQLWKVIEKYCYSVNTILHSSRFVGKNCFCLCLVSKVTSSVNSSIPFLLSECLFF